ncbi:MAG: PD-(D/E)XK nuclease family protein [Bacteroidota bacterium]
MRLHFGLSLQDGFLPLPDSTLIGEAYLGPRQLMQYLEQQLGLSVPEEDVAHLRIEQYRQALKSYLEKHPDSFYSASFMADDLGTATALLQRRDELLLAGWNFSTQAIEAPRLVVLAAIEAAVHLFPGQSDRIVAILEQADRIPHFVEELHLCDVESLYPIVWQRLFHLLRVEGLPIKTTSASTSADPESDLGRWQAFLSGAAKEKPTLRGDGSLLLIRSFRETHLAAYLAQLLRLNEAYRPAVLLPKANRTFDNALTLEGLPSLGVPAASLARPSLQVLKLAPAFLWEPLDLYKIMEFVSLAVVPLEEGLARRIATFLAETPGLFSGRWHGMIRTYFEEELPQRFNGKRKLNVDEVRREYEFWFNRKRVDSRTEKVAKSEIRTIYAHLHEWASGLGREGEAASLLVLAAQARRIVELLDALTEEELSYLELERIVRTIYEPAPLQYQPAQAGHLAYVHQPGAIIGPVPSLLWWDFFEQEPNYFFSHWYPQERKALAAIGIELESPDQQNDRLLHQRKRPVLQTKNRLILCQPDFTEGQAVQAHPLLGDLMAAFGEDLAAISLHIDKDEFGKAWDAPFALPVFGEVQPMPLASPQPIVNVPRALTAREKETPTSLESLLYYPYQWVFRYHIKLRQLNILSVIQDNRLLGNLAHRLLEQLLQAYEPSWTKATVDGWVATEMPKLLQREGATLLLYGREPERIAFIKQMKYAAWSLLTLLQKNDWEVSATEYELEGSVGPLALKGRADLVLERGSERAVVDLKWRGISRYSNLLSSGEDIQLALYSQLLASEQNFAHTAYFIIEKARLLVRNTQAFTDVQSVQDEVDHREVYQILLDRLLKTYEWRLQQLQSGEVEIRCEQTQLDLEDRYGELLLNVLEMKTGNAPFDDYDALIGLVE